MVGSNLVDIECDWALNGLRTLARDRVVIIVDVLSFSTAVTVAVGRGATIFPCEWNDERAAAMAVAEQAEVAAKRGQGRFSLAPASMRDIPSGTRLVLPSPNGSTLAYAARESGAIAVAAGCIRNAESIAQWAREQSHPIAVIPAGEQWPDGITRFAIEDWIGAGAIISRINGSMSALAAAAAAAFDVVFRRRLKEVLATSPSGRELIAKGYPDDIDIAAELDADRTVPVLSGNAFTLARS